MEQFEQLLRSYQQRLAAMIFLLVDLQSAENCLSGSILMVGITQDIYFLSELEFAVNLQVLDHPVYTYKYKTAKANLPCT